MPSVAAKNTNNNNNDVVVDVDVDVDGDKDNITKPIDDNNIAEKKLRDLHNEYYTKYRNGPSTLSMISLSKETICKSMTLTVTRDHQNRYLIDDFVADCCVSGGGKWYYEITFVGQAQYICMGFINRKYRKTSNTGLSNDYEGHSWCIVGPNTQYMHRSRNIHPVQPKDKDHDNINTGIASWAPNCTVGAKLDLDENTIEFVFEGRSTGIAFNGFSQYGTTSDDNINSGFYPCISLNQNTSIIINLGRKPFKYIKNFSDYVGFESPKYCNTSSWLNRYQLASDVTYYLSNKLVLPAKIIETCLTNEVSLEYSHEMRFEITKSNTISNTSIDNIFKDDNTLFNSNKPSGTNICFKVCGYEPTEFVLTGIVVRCSTSSNGFKVMVFISSNDSEPDFDQYSWCKHWNQSAYNQYFRNKTSSIRKPHEPITFLSTTSTSVHFKLPNPTRGKYITLKIIANTIHNGLHIEYIKFDCIHGKHPLSDLMGKNNKDEAILKRNNIIKSLKKYINIQSTINEGTTKQNDNNNNNNSNNNYIDNEKLTEMSQIIANRLSVSVSSMDCVMLEPTKEELKRFKFLNNNIRELQSRFALIKYLNKLVTPLLHYIDITLFYKNKNSDNNNNKNTTIRKQITKSLSSQVHQLKGCYFMSTKKSVFDVLLASTATSSSGSSGSPFIRSSFNRGGDHNKPRITINRIRASRVKQSGNDPHGLNSVFGQLFNGLKNYKYSNFKTNKKGAQLWNVQFSGEGSIDVGGPYRESISYSVSDLQSTATPLFILCPNGKNKVGLNREKWIPNPSSTSSLYLRMYEFVGVLMGIALRTKQTLSFDLPPLIYKKLLNYNVDISDLECIDKLCVQALDEIAKIDDNMFEYTVYETFQTSLSDGTTVSLCKNGKNIDVTKKNYESFVSLVIKKRLNESNLQIFHIKKGLNMLCEDRILSLFTWYDLEKMICGNPIINIELLRKHTVYQSGLSSSSNIVKYFWKTLHSFTQHERQLFLRFVWGRNRLPTSNSDWDSEFTIKLLNSSTSDSLPIAHTCFFSIDLPPYKSFKICRNKLLYAIHNCQAIDVDFNPNSSSLQAWIDDL